MMYRLLILTLLLTVPASGFGQDFFPYEPEPEPTGLDLIRTEPEDPDLIKTAPLEEPQPSRHTAQPTDPEQSRLASFLANVGIQYTDAGEYEDAERAYRHAIEKDPDNFELRYRLGTLYILMGRYPDAIRVLKDLAEKLPENPLVHNNLAWAYATGKGVKNGPLAVRHARMALLFTPVEPSVWNTLAEAYFVMGNYENAMRSSKMALELLSTQNPARETMENYRKQLIKIEQAATFSSLMEKESPSP